MKKDIKILAIETSCDETAASVIGEKDGNPIVLSNIVNSQVDLHAITGGVVPEVASRAHMENIIPVITEALIQASNKLQVTSYKDSNDSKLGTSNYSEAIKVLQNDITHIAVTNGPGLIGSLLVGFNAAKATAYSLDKPIIPVNHIEGHIYSAFAYCHSREGGNLLLVDPRVKPEDDTSCQFPVLSLTVSGGHTSLTLMKDHGEYETIGQTLDDAAGEAFDKVAKLLGLGYPGGPVVSKLASKFRSRKGKVEGREGIIFPRPILNNGTFNFSFSGLKTAVLQKVIDSRKQGLISEDQKEEICAAFEDAVVDVLVTKTMRAVEKFEPKAVVLAGGVAANTRLRSELAYRIQITDNSIKFLPAPKNLCGDNAAMIGLAAYYHIQKKNISTWKDIEINSNLEI
ncbi:MAG: tRNA (adenosine(37)-N6)-threonylcarbamoyltransferase complex transferase subunit TsaD [Patescibacteria group bacterium]